MTRRIRRNLLVGLSVLIALASASMLLIAKLDTNWKAEYRVRKFLLSEATSAQKKYINGCYYHASRLGGRSWLVGYEDPGIMPSLPSYCLIDRDGGISHMSPDSLSKVMRTEFDANTHDSDHDKFIEKFILLLHHEKSEIIDDARINALKSDPRNPITEDLAAKMHPPERMLDGSYIFFAYQTIGGVVRRYEFHYSSNGGFRECIVSELVNRVGPYLQYL